MLLDVHQVSQSTHIFDDWAIQARISNRHIGNYGTLVGCPSHLLANLSNYFPSLSSGNSDDSAVCHVLDLLRSPC